MDAKKYRVKFLNWKRTEPNSTALHHCRSSSGCLEIFTDSRIRKFSMQYAKNMLWEKEQQKRKVIVVILLSQKQSRTQEKEKTHRIRIRQKTVRTEIRKKAARNNQKEMI